MKHDPLENRPELGSPSHGLPLKSPVVPWLHADHRLSGPDLHIRVQWEALENFLHGSEVCRILGGEVFG